MFGLNTSSILKFVLRQGKEIKDNNPRKPAPLYDQFALDTGLAQMIQIRDVNRDPFVTLPALYHYLIVLKAFHELQSGPELHRLASRAADMYESWCQVVVNHHKNTVAQDVVFGSSILGKADGAHGSMEESVQDYFDPTDVDSPLPSLITDSSVISFASIGTPTFDIPCETLVSRSYSGDTLVDDKMSLPPLLVLWAWHAHLMRPDIYARDCEGPYKALNGVPFPLELVAEAISNGTLPLDIPDVGLKNDVPFYMKSSSASDIAALIGKQFVFIDYANQSGYLAAGLLFRNPSAGFAAITRYHGWLEVLHTTDDNRRLSNSLDIELAWKLHRLDNRKYRHETDGILGPDWFAHSRITERWSTTLHPKDEYKKRTAKHWARRFPGQKFDQPQKRSWTLSK